MKSRCESTDGHNAVTLGLLLWFLFPLFYQSSIYFHDSPSGLWVGNLSNTTRSRDQRRYYRTCYFFFGLEERVEWSDQKTQRKDGKRYKRLASLSGLADKHRSYPSPNRSEAMRQVLHSTGHRRLNKHHKQAASAARLQISSINWITDNRKSSRLLFLPYLYKNGL